MAFPIFMCFLIIQRIGELYLSRKNERWLRANGAIEYGQDHYRLIIAMHTLFFFALAGEFIITGTRPMDLFFLAILCALLLFKGWVLVSLGPYWSTKIYRIPGSRPVRRGPYKWLRHPNYVDVVLEIAVIPMVFHLYVTALVFSLLNIIVLRIRLKEEEAVWGQP